MSENNDRANIVREALAKARLCIVGGPNRDSNQYTATVYRGVSDSVPEGAYLVDGETISASGATIKEAITNCEDAALKHLGTVVEKPTEMQEMESKMSAMAAEIAALKAARAPAPPLPPKPPKADKNEPAL